MMSNDKADFRHALTAELGQDLMAGDGSHPRLEEWIAYHEGGLGEEVEERLQTHLMGCQPCREVVVELDAFNRVQEELSAGKADAVPDTASSALATAVLARAGEHQGGWAPGWSPGRHGGLLRLAASLLLLLSLAAAGWGLHLHAKVAELQDQLARASSPTGGTLIADLYPPSVRRDGGEPTSPGDPTPISIPAGTDLVTWVLHLPPGADSAGYRAELLDTEGALLWRGEALKADPRTHSLLLATPRAGLPDGSYVLRITGDGVAAEAPVTETEYALEVGPP